ncbi:amidophosphoribosyltransferase [Fructilactobacillus lindneri]|uniref:Amidophosphoribosyltransferase n=2 Tax=Fructilactobacillus lindneri TaxID=53444 RepID=A0A0R2JNC4_9LACO|nr:amidophosphoribosyltransferase [Fructilactobacillus lindneri]ANZ57905.1 amidophosphoribosyltransferase [Fructilactobacillus lindneri]ANZ59174.1 amidophosphoribosyltransferase [Fructilactobacillus lindneri]KRN78625.1 amidophosphoribosyltransferase [Fructilactobacillus lindneri DSM 20690 = JCM 11027]POG98224.1 amidophosphoribosyltransferase [Fructilactobacillus lindneri]POH01659.1 amidophosphoribosyltransferase [Fructilactobacillus lindneri]
MAIEPLKSANSLNEECGIFGVWGMPNAAELTFYGLHALQHRGQEGTGIVANNHGHLWQERGLGLLSTVFEDPQKLKNLKGNAALGHVRYATAGSGGVENIQPFMVNFNDMQVALAHNGNITNAKTLRKELEDKGAIFQSSSDTEILLHLIRRSKKATFVEQLKEALNQIHGGFAVLLMTPDGIYAALDPHGYRPFVIGQLPNGAYVATSETAALNAVGARFVRDVQPGELITINDQGMKIDHYTTDTTLNIDSMEYIYFARPDSDIYGVNVHQARKRMGEQLAKEAPANADIVVAVPNSSLSATMGYAEASGLPNEMGLIKNQYIARTFIEPTQERRERAVRMKLSAIPSVLKGKRVVLVDDSIVRGTTSKYIIRMLREAGAKEVHVRIASPAFKYPSFYGIDMQTSKELMAANNSTEEMRKKIGADSLQFLSTEGLVDSIGLQHAGKGNGLTTAYFDGHYPSPIYDYEPELAAKEKTGEITFDPEVGQ